MAYRMTRGQCQGRQIGKKLYTAITHYTGIESSNNLNPWWDTVIWRKPGELPIQTITYYQTNSTGGDYTRSNLSTTGDRENKTQGCL
jgi:hypothetical protein